MLAFFSKLYYLIGKGFCTFFLMKPICRNYSKRLDNSFYYGRYHIASATSLMMFEGPPLPRYLTWNHWPIFVPNINLQCFLLQLWKSLILMNGDFSYDKVSPSPIMNKDGYRSALIYYEQQRRRHQLLFFTVVVSYLILHTYTNEKLMRASKGLSYRHYLEDHPSCLVLVEEKKDDKGSPQPFPNDMKNSNITHLVIEFHWILKRISQKLEVTCGDLQRFAEFRGVLVEFRGVSLSFAGVCRVSRSFAEFCRVSRSFAKICRDSLRLEETHKDLTAYSLLQP